MACEHCTAPNGDVGYPYYGHAPGLGTWYCPACKEAMEGEI